MTSLSGKPLPLLDSDATPVERYLAAILEELQFQRKQNDPPPTIEIRTGRELDGRWIAEVIGRPGVLAYGATEQQAIRKVRNLAAKVIEMPKAA